MSMRIVAPPGRRSVITKDLCTYTTIILRHEKNLRDRGAGTAVPAVSGGVVYGEQALGRVDDEEAAGYVHLGDDRLHERDQDLLGSSAGGTGRPGEAIGPCGAGGADPVDD